MTKVITYGTYDLLHYGHIRLLERAKALGDYLIVGVTADDFDMRRGKINVKQPLLERIAAVKATGLADEIIVEEYEGQKIDDIQKYDVDIFTVGTDWEGKFDYLNKYCRVVYLERTEGVSSSEIRAEKNTVRMGLVGEINVIDKIKRECGFVNGVELAGLCSRSRELRLQYEKDGLFSTACYEELLERSDAVYIISEPSKHYEQIRMALLRGKHVLCEAPLAVKKEELDELFSLADEQGLAFMPATKTAYSTAYYRMLLLANSGKIGRVVSVDATCTSLREIDTSDKELLSQSWNSICGWGPTAMLPIFQLLGTEYSEKHILSWFADYDMRYDQFTKVDFTYPNATATLKVGKGIKSEGELIVSGTKGYIYVPAPWWKTDYFEIRYENQEDNQRYFWQLDGEGIRYAISNFTKAIGTGRRSVYIERDVSEAITKVIEDFNSGKDLQAISLP